MANKNRYGDRVPGGFISTQQNVNYNKDKNNARNQEDIMSELQKAQRRQAIAGLTSAKDTALSNLTKREKEIAPRFQEAERSTVGKSRTGSKGFADFLATRGLSSAGVAAEGEIQRQGQLQSNLGQLEVAEQQERANILANRGDIERKFESDVASAEAGITAQGLQNAIVQQQRQESLDIAEQERQENQRRYEAGIERQNIADANKLLQEQQNREIQNRGQYQPDIQAEINRRIATPSTDDDFLIPYLKTDRVNKISGIEQGQQSQQQQQQELAREQAEFRLKQFGYVANDQDAQILGVPRGTRTADYQNQLSIISNRNRTSAPKDRFSTSNFTGGIKTAVGELGSIGEFGEKIPASVAQIRATTSDYIVRENASGRMSDEQAQQLIIQNNLSAEDIIQAENRVGLLEELRGN